MIEISSNMVEEVEVILIDSSGKGANAARQKKLADRAASEMATVDQYLKVPLSPTPTTKKT